jgi:solute:Na+ symporter, SSS family
VGMLFGFVVNLYLWRWTRVPWTWWVPVGAAVTFAVGYMVSLFLQDESPEIVGPA